MFSWMARGDRRTRWWDVFRGPSAGAGALTLILCLVVCLADRERAGAQVPDTGPGRPLIPPPSIGAGRVPARDLFIGRAPEIPAGGVEKVSAAGEAAAVPAAVSAPIVPGTPTGLPLTPTPYFTPGAEKYIKQALGPDNIMEVIVGRLQIFNLVKAPSRIQIGDESVGNYALLSPTELSLQGLRVGTTVLNMWFQEPGEKNNKLISFLVRVLPDPDARARLERAYKNLENEVNKAFPNSKISLLLVGDKLGVYGQARDVAEANFIMRMIQANVLPRTADSPDLGRSAAADPVNYANYQYGNDPAFHRNVVNMIRVVGEQQVQLHVQVVEVNRAAARSIGLNFAVFRNSGHFFVGGTTNNLGIGQTGSGFSSFSSGLTNTTSLTGLGGIPNLPVALDFGQIQLAIAALQSLSYARYLAEPNLVAINGQTAQFQVGSLLPVPVLSGASNNNSNLEGVNFIPTGVQLAFTPYHHRPGPRPADDQCRDQRPRHQLRADHHRRGRRPQPGDAELLDDRGTTGGPDPCRGGLDREQAGIRRQPPAVPGLCPPVEPPRGLRQHLQHGEGDGDPGDAAADSASGMRSGAAAAGRGDPGAERLRVLHPRSAREPHRPRLSQHGPNGLQPEAGVPHDGADDAERSVGSEHRSSGRSDRRGFDAGAGQDRRAAARAQDAAARRSDQHERWAGFHELWNSRSALNGMSRTTVIHRSGQMIHEHRSKDT